MKSQMYVGYKFDAMQLMATPDFHGIYDKTVVLAGDIPEVIRLLDEIPNAQSHPRMLKTLTMPEMKVVRHYTFEDWGSKYTNIDAHPETSSLYRVKYDLGGAKADQTIMQLTGDSIHESISIQFDASQDAQDMYRTMRRIAFDRGELLAEYNQAMQRYPHTMGITAWYQTIAAADPTKDSPLFEGHYVEHYVQSLKECKAEMPRYTPGFMLVANAMIQAADQLSGSLDDKTAALFKSVRAVAEDKLAAGYHEWCCSLQPDTYLSRVLEKLPEDTHDYVTAMFTARLHMVAQENPQRSEQANAAIAMHETIKACANRIKDDALENQISFHGRVPTSLDIHCFDMTYPEVSVIKEEMSVVSWYGGDAPEYANEDIEIKE